jgi:multidrug transporter EmrE-like cation transporter
MTIWSQAQGPSVWRRRLSLWALCGVLPFLSLGYQIAAKETALAMSQTAFGWGWLAHLVRQPWAQGLLLLEIASFAAWMTALSEMKLSAAFPMSAVGYVLIIVTGWTLFHEPAGLLQVVGGAIILSGIWLIGRSEPEESQSP